MQKMNDLVSREAVLKLIIDAQYKLNCDLSALILDVAEMPTSSGWISTKDRLPEKRGKYAVIIDGFAATATYEPDFEETKRWGNWYERFDLITMASIDTDWENIEAEITHWLPLPDNKETDIAKTNETVAKAKSMLLGRILMCATILDGLDHYSETPELVVLAEWISNIMNRYQRELDYLKRRSTDEIHSD